MTYIKPYASTSPIIKQYRDQDQEVKFLEKYPYR